MIVSSAIIDDTIGWIIMSVTFGLALHGGIDLASVAKSLIGVDDRAPADLSFDPLGQ